MTLQDAKTVSDEIEKGAKKTKLNYLQQINIYIALQLMKKYLIPLKNIPNSRLECTNHTLFQTKMVEIDTLFQTKTAKKNIPFGVAHTHIA